MKRIVYFFCVLSFSILACGTTLPTPNQLGSVNTATPYPQLPVKVVIASEPTDNAPRYVTTAPLNVRACASVKCEKIADPLPEGTEVLIIVTDILSKDGSDGCYLGEWYAIESPVAGFVCSLYVEEK